MFDAGFWELLVVLTIVLLVLGPERLPGFVSSVGRMIGRARSLATGLRMQMERELKQDAVTTPPAEPTGAEPAAGTPVGTPSRESPPTRPDAGAKTGAKPDGQE